MKSAWIFGFSIAAALVAACLSGVQGDRTGGECRSDADCPVGLGMTCNSSGNCVYTPCEINSDCTDEGLFNARCDGGNCRIPCTYGCFGGICDNDTNLCMPDTTAGTIGMPNDLPILGPGAAGGAGGSPRFPIPDGRYYDDFEN